ncbi:MAG TPA: hypothetical protein VGM11_06570 [Acidobacteriaceae bacterium]|jgi:hypothetical protein
MPTATRPVESRSRPPGSGVGLGARVLVLPVLVPGSVFWGSSAAMADRVPLDKD